MSTGQSLSPIPEPANEPAEPTIEPTESSNSFVEDDEWDGQDRSLVEGVQPERSLEEGACVVFFNARGQLMVVRANGRFWELHPITVGQTCYDADGVQRLVFYPPEATFTVMKKGRLVGFSSLAAEGRHLQAVRGDGNPHRINNHNFGDWESWEQTPEGLKNVKWNKGLGLDIKEVRSVAVQDLKGAQRSHLRSIRLMQKKVGASDERIAESERRVKEALRTGQRQQALHQKELTHLRGRLEVALKAQQKRDMESIQSGAAYKEVEQRFVKLMEEKDALEHAAGQEKQRFEFLQRELELIRERHDGEMHRLELAHSSEMNALTREKDLEAKQAKQIYEDHLSRLRSDLGSKAQKKDTRITELEGQFGGTLREKEQQIADLTDECSRLHSALKAIKGQVEQAHITKVSLEAGQMCLSPVLNSPVRRGSQQSPVLQPGASLTSSNRSGRSSADPVLCRQPSPIPGALQGRSRFHDGPMMDRSGARAPTPSYDAFPPKAASPSSVHSDANPPATVDTDHSGEEPALPAQEHSLSFGFPSCEVQSELAAQRLRQTLQQDSISLRKGSLRDSDGYESDNSFQSASEDVEGLDGLQRLNRSLSSFSHKSGSSAGGARGGKDTRSKATGALRSFPINSTDSSC